jgi:hypothetical protein
MNAASAFPVALQPISARGPSPREGQGMARCAHRWGEPVALPRPFPRARYADVDVTLSATAADSFLASGDDPLARSVAPYRVGGVGAARLLEEMAHGALWALAPACQWVRRGSGPRLPVLCFHVWNWVFIGFSRVGSIQFSSVQFRSVHLPTRRSDRSAADERAVLGAVRTAHCGSAVPQCGLFHCALRTKTAHCVHALRSKKTQCVHEMRTDYPAVRSASTAQGDRNVRSSPPALRPRPVAEPRPVASNPHPIIRRSGLHAHAHAGFQE